MVNHIEGGRHEVEDSSMLRFGPGTARGHTLGLVQHCTSEHHFVCADFSQAKPLMNSEVAQILEHKRQIMQRKGVQPKKYVCCPSSVHTR